MVKTALVFRGQGPRPAGVSRGLEVMRAVPPFASPRAVEAVAAGRGAEGRR